MGLDDGPEKDLGLQRVVAISSGVDQNWCHFIKQSRGITEQKPDLVRSQN